MNTCRFCHNWDRQGEMVKYGVRHYAHVNCAIQRWGIGFRNKFSSFQLSQIPRHLLTPEVDAAVQDQLRGGAA